jgi:L,D-peptidoglycan transpeptidase YkuD (ErfK/YbiS/YcfS/YnhG family)
MRIEVDPAGVLRCQNHTWRCALGRGGVKSDKSEGDGATPAGIWLLGTVYYRADRLSPPQTALNTIATRSEWGWCDDPTHPDYNRLITLPHPAHHEILWREDGLYDVVVEIHYNSDPVIKGRGSAIFMHIAKSDYAPTEGCVALARDDLLQLLQLCNKGDEISFRP